MLLSPRGCLLHYWKLKKHQEIFWAFRLQLDGPTHESFYDRNHDGFYHRNHQLNLCPPPAGPDATARRYGQRLRPSWWGSTAIHHSAAPHDPFCVSVNLHGIHPVKHLHPDVLRRLRRNSEGCLPGWQRRATRHALPRHLLCHWNRELGRRLRAQGQIRRLHPGVQVHPLDPRWHCSADAQRNEPQQEEKAPRPHQKALPVKEWGSSLPSGGQLPLEIANCFVETKDFLVHM